MKMIYLVVILAVTILMGWAIHRYTVLTIFGPGGAPAGSSVMAPSVVPTRLGLARS
jgi:hypothetical protein